MKQKILFYRWGALSESEVEEELRNSNVEYCTYAKRMKDYHADAEFAMEFLQVLHGENVQIVFSFDYFPLISMLCEMNRIPYVSWIYDCPMYTLHSKTLSNNMNYIFCFDRNYVVYLQELGAKNCIHFPLAANARRMEKIFCIVDKNMKYSCDISFVGNLYSEKKNRLRRANLSEYCRGYVEGIIESQLKIYGYNFIRESLTEDIVEEVIDKCQLSLSDMYHLDSVGMVADSIGMEVSARERECVLGVLGKYFDIDLYSGSKLPSSLQGLRIHEKGYADYEKEMPYIFHASKINLNITSKTITSGIPLRVFDIVSCGGFCMTNYQPEISEYFVDGKELVMYTSMEDLVEKVVYYLEHDEERKQIARNGYEKLKRNHNLGNKIEEILEYIN